MVLLVYISFPYNLQLTCVGRNISLRKTADQVKIYMAEVGKLAQWPNSASSLFLYMRFFLVYFVFITQQYSFIYVLSMVIFML